MTREEQIIKAAKTCEKEEGFSPIVMKARGVNSAVGIGFLEGAVWADNNPRTDIIGEDSITYVRNILVGKFYNIAKKNPGKIYDEVPEMKEVYDLVDNFDKACEIAGFELDDDIGFYKTKRNVHAKSVIKNIFSELTESEDEKVRKALIEMVHDTTGDSLWVDYNIHKEEALAWLEKQGQKPITIDVDKMVEDFTHTNVNGYGCPCMVEIDAYRKGINDVLTKYLLNGR